MTAETLITCTDKYHAGFRRARLWQDPACRWAVLLILAMTCVTYAASMLLPLKYRSTAEITMLLWVVLPGAIRLAGGMPRNCVALYIAAAALYEAALLPALLHLCYYSLALAAPALLLAALIFRRAPWILDNVAYTGTKLSTFELPVIVSCSAFLSLMSIYSFETVERISVNLALPAAVYLMHFLYGLAFYGTAFALMYGIIARRLLTLRFSILTVIVLCIVLHFVLVIPMSVGIDRTFLHWASGETASAIGTQFIMGMTFYYFRTGRPGLIIYLVYMLFYNAVFLSR